MARMHSRKRGKSGSTRPEKKTKPSWLRYKAEEVEMLIVKLAKSENSASQIGVQLRDVYGIPSIKAVIGKSITHFLAEKKLTSKLPEDLIALIRKSIAVRKHLEQNKQDQTAKRGLTLTESKIKRLTTYYKGTGKVSEDWKFDPSNVQLYVQ